MRRFIILLFVLFLPSTANANSAVVKLNKKGMMNTNLNVENIKMLCGDDLNDSFVVEINGAITEIPFDAIEFIIHNIELNNYQVGIKKRTENKSLFALKPVCSEFKFIGENDFGGRVIISPEHIDRIDFK